MVNTLDLKIFKNIMPVSYTFTIWAFILSMLLSKFYLPVNNPTKYNSPCNQTWNLSTGSKTAYKNIKNIF